MSSFTFTQFQHLRKLPYTLHIQHDFGLNFRTLKFEFASKKQIPIEIVIWIFKWACTGIWRHGFTMHDASAILIK